MVRSPIRGHPGMPDVAVFRNAVPIAVVIEVLGAVYALSDVAGAGGLHYDAVAAFAPTVPIVQAAGVQDLEFGIGRRPARRQRLAVTNPLRPPWREDLDVAVAGRNFR